MKISIITVCYNSEQTIQDTINSVASQTYLNVEYIIVDGASKDSTLDIIKRNESKISKWISEKDKGIYDAMNKGLSIASGDVIGILNADDLFVDNNVIEKVVEAFRDESIMGSYADLKYVKRDELSKVIRFWKSGDYREGKFLNGWMPPHPTFYARKSIFEKLGNYRTDMPSAADYELMLRFIHVHKIKIKYIPHVLVMMREGGISNKSLLNRLSANKDDRRAWYVNNVKPMFYTLYLKPLSKIIQFIFKD